jgi:hypothetical protein
MKRWTNRKPKPQEAPTKASVRSGALGLLAFVLLVAWAAMSPSLKSDTRPAARNSTTPSQWPASQALKERQGAHQSYKYSVLYEDSDKRYAATFTPFLPRDDATVVGAMRELVNTTYGAGKAGTEGRQLYS